MPISSIIFSFIVRLHPVSEPTAGPRRPSSSPWPFRISGEHLLDSVSSLFHLLVDPAMLLVSMVPAAALAGADFATGPAKCVLEFISEIRPKSSFRRRCECCLFQSLSSSSSSSSPSTGRQQGKMASLLNFWWQGHPSWSIRQGNWGLLTKRSSP